jgi:hypothetical protein
VRFAFFSAPPGELGAERIESLSPEGTEWLEPTIDVLQGSGLHGVETTRTLRADARKAVLAKHTQVLRDRGLADAEFQGDDSHDLTRRPLVLEEQLEDPPAHRVCEDVERVHRGRVSVET